MMSHDLDKSVKRKPKRRIVEDLSSDNSGSEGKTYHSGNNKMGEEYFRCLRTLVFHCFSWLYGFCTIIINDGWSLVDMFPKCDRRLRKGNVVEVFHLYEYWKIQLW